MGDTEGYGSASTHDSVTEKTVHQHQEATARPEFGETDNIDIGKGVRQGRILSQLLFNIYAENIMRGFGRMEEWNQRRKEDVTNLRYAIHTTLLAGQSHWDQ